jgi:hypothetical protein
MVEIHATHSPLHVLPANCQLAAQTANGHTIDAFVQEDCLTDAEAAHELFRV